MDWLNYHHLYYFWTVAREGTVSKAAETLRLAQPTVSAQIRQFERALGHRLFQKSGRKLALTDSGHTVFRYADEIFTIGREMTQTLRGQGPGRPSRFLVGIADVVPKWIAYRLIAPALQLPEPLQLVCREDKTERLYSDLAVHGLDLVISDAPLSADVRVKAYNHMLGECGIALMASPALARKLKGGFPASLDGAPFLLPSSGTSLRRTLDAWFEARNIRPRVIGEFDDSALVKAFGQAGAGCFAVPDVIAAEVGSQLGVVLLGGLDGPRERFYAISVERRLRHPGIVAITQAARTRLFA